MAQLSKNRGATTVIRAYGVLAGILDDAVKSSPSAGEPGSWCGEPATQDDQAPGVSDRRRCGQPSDAIQVPNVGADPGLYRPAMGRSGRTAGA